MLDFFGASIKPRLKSADDLKSSKYSHEMQPTEDVFAVIAIWKPQIDGKTSSTITTFKSMAKYSARATIKSAVEYSSRAAITDFQSRLKSTVSREPMPASKDRIGHAAMLIKRHPYSQLDENLYISLWPKNNAGVINIVEGAFQQNMEADSAAEEGEPDYVGIIYCLDFDNMIKFYKENYQEIQYSLKGLKSTKNCSGLIYDLLVKGRIFDLHKVKTVFQRDYFISTPENLIELIQTSVDYENKNHFQTKIFRENLSKNVFSIVNEIKDSHYFIAFRKKYYFLYNMIDLVYREEIERKFLGLIKSDICEKLSRQEFDAAFELIKACEYLYPNLTEADKKEMYKTFEKPALLFRKNSSPSLFKHVENNIVGFMVLLLICVYMIVNCIFQVTPEEKNFTNMRP
jgi:hypothetical protein